MKFLPGSSAAFSIFAAAALASNICSIGAVVPYFADFEGVVGPEWSSTTQDTSHPSTFTSFSGRFGNATQSLTISGLTAGQQYVVGFDFYPIDSWDGGGDTLAVEVDGEQKFRESFSNYNGNPPSVAQSYPFNPDIGRMSLGFHGSYVDAIYRNIEVPFTASGDTAVISFKGIGLQDISDESWGIDNVWVKTASAAAASFIMSSSLPAHGGTAAIAIDSFSILANHALEATAASAAGNYSLIEAGVNGTFGDGDDSVRNLTPAFNGNKTIHFEISPSQAPLQPGKYRFQAANLKDASGGNLAVHTREFTLQHPVNGRIESLANNTLQEAVALPLAETPVGSQFYTAYGIGRFANTANNGELDWWRFDAETGDYVTVRIEADELGIYPQIQLYNSAGNYLTGAGGNYEGIAWIQQYRVTQPGTYYIRSWTDQRRAGYRMRVDLSRGVAMEYEDNDSTSQGNQLALNATEGGASARIAGALDSYDAAGDFYRITVLNPGNVVALNLVYPEGSTVNAGVTSLALFRAGEAEAAAQADGASLNFTITDDGVYYARVQSIQPDLRGWYILSLTTVDGVAPAVTAADLPEENSTETAIRDRFTLSFSEELQPETVTESANYELRSAGADNAFGTADDILYNVAPQPYSTGLTVSYLVPDGPLQAGKYRFTAKTGIEDRAGNSMAADYVRNFTIGVLEGYTRETRDNESSATASSLVFSGTAGENFEAVRGHGNLEDGADADYWSFNAVAGDLVILNTESATHLSGSGLTWQILRADGTVLAQFNAGADGSGQSAPVTISEDGAYYIRPHFYWDYRGEYRFHLSKTHSEQPGLIIGEIENNNSFNEAYFPALVIDGITRSVEIMAVDPRHDASGDYFRLGHLAPGASIDVTLRKPSSSAFAGTISIHRQNGGEVASSEPGETSLGYVLPADGADAYVVRINDPAEGTLRNQYFVTLSVTDSTAPTITSITLPSESSLNTHVPPTFQVRFSEDMLPASVNDSASYELKNTTDNSTYTVSSEGYSHGLAVTLRISDGPLQPGSYVFTVKTALKDAGNNPLASSMTRNFQVQGVEGYVYEDRDNDTFAKATSLSLASSSTPDGSFELAKTLTPTGSNPYSLHTADLNKDGRTDFVTANYGGGGVSVYLGQGNGNWADAVHHATAANPLYVVSGDVNGDSNIDLVAAAYGPNQASVLLGNGDGTFGEPANFAVGSNPRAIAVADLNGDSRLDIIAANYSTHNVSVLIGNGDGTFQAKVDYPAGGNGAHALEVTDLNGDSFADLIVANYGSDTIGVLTGNGNGTFNTSVTYPVGSNPRSVTVADFNGDGRKDIAVAHNASANNVHVLDGQPGGTFAQSRVFSTNLSDPYDIETADLTGDGYLDLIIASYGSSYVNILKGVPEGAFVAATRYHVPGNPISVAIGDYIPDGRLDVASANHQGNSVTILSGRASQVLTEDPAGSGIRTATGRGYLSTGGDLDVFSFSATAGDRLVVASENVGSVNNSGLLYEIFYPQGDRWTYFYPHNQGWGQAEPLTVPYDGTYYVRVSQWHSYGGEYRFRVTLAPASVQLEVENNNTLTEANVAALKLESGHQLGTILGYFSVGDLSGDYFSIGNLSVGTAIQLDITKPLTSKVATRLNIFNSANNLVHQSAIGAASSEYIVPEGGDGAHRVQVESIMPSRAGQPGPFLSFNGGNQYVELGAWSPGKIWTAQAWVRSSGYINGRRGIVGGWSSCQDWGLVLDSGRLGLSYRPPGGDCSATLLADELVELGKWYHVAATSDGETAKLYVNGVLAKSTPVAADWAPYAGRTLIGAEHCCGNYFWGNIDEVSIWSRELDAGEIQAGMTAVYAGNEPDLAGYWQMDEGDGTTVADRSTHARVGSTVNNPSWQSAGPADTRSHGLYSQYILDIDLADTSPPLVTSASLPAEGESVPFVHPAFTIGFSEDMTAATVNGAANYELISAGPDNVFGNANDHAYTVEASGYVAGLSANLYITDGPLQPGLYRFTVGTGMLDRAGSPLAVAYTRNFEVASLEGFVRESLNNDTFANATQLSPSVAADPDGSFVDPINSEAGGGGSRDLVVARINSDALLDVVVVNGSSDDVSVYLGNGDGTLQAPANFSTGDNPQSIAAGDLNGDTFRDIVVANRSADTISVLLGNGDGSFQSKVDYATGDEPTDVLLADFNKDGRLDAVTANYNSDNLSFLAGSGNGGFAAPVHFAAGNGAYQIAAGDFNNDTHLDLAITCWVGDNLVLVLGNGNGNFESPVSYATGNSPRWIAAGDLNNDSRLDLALIDGGNRVRIFLGNGTGAFPAAESFAAGTSDPYGIALSDINADGILDIFVASYGNSRVVYFEGTGGGQFRSKVDYMVAGNPLGIVAEDINGDGRRDIITANYSSGNVSIWLGRGTQVLPENPVGSGLRTVFAHGNLDAGDQDIFSFSGMAGDRVEVAVEVPGNTAGSELRYGLYEPDGDRLDYFDSNDSGYGQSPRTKGTIWELPYTGTWYVVVSRQDAYAGEYRLRMSVASAPLVFEAEPNNQVSQADALSFSLVESSVRSQVAGYFSVGDTSGDFYGIGNLSEGTTIRASVERPSHSDTGVQFAILNATGTVVSESAADVTSFAYTIPNGASGSYYLRLNATSGTRGIFAQYLATISLTDVQGPAVASNSLPGEGSSVTSIIDRFSLTFSEELLAASANLASNYDLRAAGVDGLFDTADDEIYPLSGFGYGSGLSLAIRSSSGPLQPGAYRFQVMGVQDRSGNPMPVPHVRTFTVAPIAGYTLETPNNDTAENATELALIESPVELRGALARGNLSSTADVDYYSFEAAAGSTLILGVDIPGNPGASSLHYQVFRPDGTRILNFNSDYSGYDQARAVLPVDGIYTIVVSYNYDFQGEYLMNVMVVNPPAVAETENNNSIANAMAVELEANGNSRRATLAGYSYNNSELDYFNLGALTNGSTVFLATRISAGSQSAPQVSLYQANGGYITEAGSGRAGDGVAEVRILADGTYYAAVRPGPGRQGVDSAYLLDIQVVPTGSVAFPNLQVAGLTPPSGAIRSGDTVNFSFAVRNVGSVATPVATWEDRVVISQNNILGDADDVQLGIYAHDGVLNFGGEYVVTESAKLPDGIAGSYYFIVTTDFKNAVNEFVLEGDNTSVSEGTFPILLAPYPDLVVENLAVAAPVGSAYAISWKTANRGAAPVDAAFKERLFVRNTRTGDVLVNTEREVASAIAVGATLNQSASINATVPGVYQVLVTTDSSSRVYENNNDGHAAAELNAFETSFTILADYLITVAANPAQGGTVSGGGTLKEGSTATVRAVPNTSTLPYAFLNWTENGIFRSADAEYNFTVTGNRQLVANFVLPSFTVTANNNPSAGGTVTGGGSYTHGSTATLRAIPNFGYKFNNWTEGATVLGVEPTLTLTITGNRTIRANYSDAHLTHVVTTATSPSGIAAVTGGGTFNNGQSTTITAPESVTQSEMVYTFKRFTLNGAAYNNNRTFNETFTTTDPTNMLFVAEYDSRSEFPLVTNVFASLNNPVPRTENLVLSFQFNRSMKSTPEPVVTITNSRAGAVQPVVLTGGTWSTTVNSNDTYRIPAVTIAAGMDGTNQVFIAGAHDLDGAASKNSNVYSLVVDATLPVISGVNVERGSGAAVVTWTTDEPANSQVEFGATTAYGRKTPLSINLVTAHRVMVTGLTPETAYNFRVISQDRAGNSRASANGTFTTLPAPDLRITGILPAPALWQSGSAVSVVWTNLNAGVGPTSGSFYDQVIVSNKTTGSVLVNDYVHYDASRFGNIAPNTFKTGEYLFELPHGPAGAGELVIIVTTDFYDNVIESNGSNNAEVNNAFAATRNSALRSYADLQVQQLAASPANIESGMNVTVTWNVANTGGAPAGGTIHDRIVVRNTTTGEWLVNQALPYDTAAASNVPILDGESLPRQFAFRLPDGNRGAGQLLVEVTTDAENSLFEHNNGNTGESNNKAAINPVSTLAVYPDLTVTSITAPANATAGQSVDISWTVQNRGSAAATGPWTDHVFISQDNVIGNDQYVGSFPHEGNLGGNTSLPRSGSITLPRFGTGNRWIVIKTDAGAAIYESEEANNTTIDDLAVNLPSNLLLSLSRAAVREDAGANAIQATITRNSGTANALTVNLTSSDLSEATVPASITIQAGQASASFWIAAVDDHLVDGAQPVTISASAAGLAGVTADISVTDEDSAVLTLIVMPAGIRENAGATAGQGTITRNTPTTEALVVSLASSDTSKLTVPVTVTIPAGQESASFSVAAIDNDIPNRPAQINITASVTGYQSLPARVEVLDDDLPDLTVELDKPTISEGDANPATYGTITRSPVRDYALNVLVQGNNSSAAKMPVTVTIPPGQASVTFPITAVNNDLVDLPREIQIWAYTADSVFETPIEEGSGVAILTVTDDDGPTLSLRLNSEVISERSTTTATVTRNTPTTTALVVNLASDDGGEATVPASVTIPVGQRSANFTVSGVVDALADGIQPVNITAAASGFTAGSARVNVSDIDLPDLRVTGTTLPVEALTGGNVTVAWKVKNEGLSTAPGPWIDRVYLSNTPDGANLQYLGQFIRSGDLPVGEEYERSAFVSLPATPGNFYLVVVTDAALAVTEGVEMNNTSVSMASVTVAPAYRAEVSTDVETTGTGSVIPLVGRAFKTGSEDPAPFALVSVRINVKGTRRVIEARADASGNFETRFVPLPNEAGLVSIGADHPGVEQDPIQDQVEIYGVRFTDYDLNLRMFPMSDLEGSFQISNLGDLPLTEVELAGVDLPPGVTVEFTHTNELAGLEAANVGYKFTAGNITNEVRWRSLLRITTAEGATANLPVNITVAPHRATLVANPGVLSGGMLRGEQRIVEFTVSNVGGAATGPIEVRYPAVEWLKLASSSNLASLNPGDSTTVTLQLVPPADMPLTRYDGSLVIAAPAANVGLNVPFSYRAISDARGDLRVEVTDDYTFHVAGAPKVEGATVTLTDGLTGERVISGNTDSDGIVLFEGLMEGTYQMTVTASKHSTYRGPVTITPGDVTEVTTFIDRQTVSYRWTVVPTEIEDHYKVVLETVFETEVPIPVVTIDNPMMMPLIVEGMDTHFEVRVTNHGLIAAERISVVLPENPNFEIIPVVDMIDVLPAKTTMSIPMIARAKPGAQFASFEQFQERMALKRECERQGGLSRQCGKTFTGCDVYPKLQVKWSFVCGNDRRWHVNDASIMAVCVDESCWDKLKDFLEGLAKNPKDILEWKDQLCEVAAVLASCVDECLGSIVKAACGVATRDIKGAIEGALGFGQCWCPTLPSIPVGGGTTPPPTGGGPGGGGGYIGSADYPVGSPIYWDYSPDCTPGDTVSGGNSLARQAETQPGGVCARVRLRIEQEAVVTRAAFIGTLELENGHTEEDLTDIQLTLDIRDEFQAPANEKFSIRGPDLSNLTAVDGTGFIARGQTGIAKYTFIPNRLAAPEGPVVFRIGGTLRYREGDNLVEVPLLPDTITVFPDPVLHLAYFQQRDVYSDDPFTDEVEPAEPFALGLLVKNTGKGAALNFRITSAQPEIIENEKGLLIDFKIIGTQVGGESVEPTLTANLGRIESGASKVAIWQMISTLQGKFIDYTASFEHLDAFGDRHLSLIDSVEIHELIHAVRADRAGDDTQPDFLVNDDPDEENLPDTLYLSDGSVHPVNLAVNAQADAPASLGDLQVQVTATVTSGWNYLKMADPGANFRLYRVVRSDGKEMRVTDNAWTTDRSFPSALAGARRENLFHLLDFNSTGAYTLHYRINDSVAPAVADIIDIDPIVQTDALDQIDVVFSEDIDISTITAEDIQLTLNGAAIDFEGPLNVVKVGAPAVSTYRLSGFGALTAAEGNYQIVVNGAGVLDFGGNPAEGAAVVNWSKTSGIAPVLVSISQVTPALRNLPVTSLDVVFSKGIDAGTLDFNDIVLTRNGSANLISSGITITPLTASSFRIAGLGSLTAESGDYRFAINASGVTDASGNAGTGELSVSWTQDTAGPTIASLEQVNTNPRNIVVPSLEVRFSEPVNMFNHTAVTLSRNDGPNLITSQTRVTRLAADTYRISDFSFVSGHEGTYVLTVNAPAVRDLAGNAGLGSASASWIMDTTKPATPASLAITPDLGKLATDFLTSTQKFLFHGSLAETNLTVRLMDMTANEDLGAATVTDKAFEHALDLPQGPHRIRVRAVDAAANTSVDAYVDVFVDLSAPGVSIAPVQPDPIDAAVPSIDITFTELINDTTLTHEDLILTLNNGANLVTSDVEIEFVGSNVYRITGLEALTSAPGLYNLTLKTSGVEDLAGNKGGDDAVETWRRLGGNSAPTLVPIPDQIVSADTMLTITNKATDLDIPANLLTFSLGAGAPTGASIDPVTGVFSWKPARAQAGEDYTIRVIVTDNGVPALSDTEEFVVTVADYAEINVGRAIVQTGQRSSLPIEFFSSAEVKQFSFMVEIRENYLGNLTVDALVPEVQAATIELVNGSRYLITVQARGDASFSERANVVELGFNALADRSSTFIHLHPEALVVTKADNSGIDRLYTRNGRIAVIGAEPLLEALVESSGARSLVVYGNPGATYELQWKPALEEDEIWTGLSDITLPGLFEILDIESSGTRELYFRAVQQP